MSWLSKAIRGVGKLAKKAAPVLGMIPGVGTLAGGVIGGLGGLASGGLKGALQGAAGGVSGGLLSKVGSAFGSGQQGAGGQDQGWLSRIGGFLGDNSDLIMGGVNAYQNAQDQTRRDELMNEAMGWARDDRARNQALYGRIQGLDPSAGRPDLTQTFADPSNPFYRAPSRPQIASLTQPERRPATQPPPTLGPPPGKAKPRGVRGIGRRLNGDDDDDGRRMLPRVT